MNKVKVGVIGTGHLGSLHAKMFAQIDQAELVGVYDTNSVQAEKIAAEFHTKAFDQVDDLIKNVEAASVASVTQSHFDVGMKVLGYGVHLLVEKRAS
jgi:predicted dehydrogenase